MCTYMYIYIYTHSSRLSTDICPASTNSCGRAPNDRVCKLNGQPPYGCHTYPMELGYDNWYNNSMAGGSLYIYIYIYVCMCIYIYIYICILIIVSITIILNMFIIIRIVINLILITINIIPKQRNSVAG